jgi:hypothetical protein
MTSAPLNGHGSPPDPNSAVARTVYEANLADGDQAWCALTDDERGMLADYAGEYVMAHIAWLTATGHRLVRPGAILKPTSEPEAMAMVKAAKDFLDGMMRKGQLMGAPMAGKKLILPPGVH